ncbi:3-deoxy-D-manno-octulosonic acid transferase [Marinomonas epiphytica]
MWWYRIVLLLLTPFILLKLRRFQRQYEGYRFSEALGAWSPLSVDLWVHCASVGEVLAARPLIHAWQESHPGASLLITTVTPTGAEQVAKAFPNANHKYLPVDLMWCVKRALKSLSCPQLWVVETELWPNLLSVAKRQGRRISVVNARLSERSFRRYKKFSSLSATIMAQPDLILAHGDDDAARFRQLGASHVEVTGSIKFDLQPSEAVLASNWRELIGTSFVWVAASTHQGEDELFLKAHQTLREHIHDAILIIVPRHPERFTDVFGMAQQTFALTGRRSETPPQNWSDFAVLIGDSMGELMHYYQASDVALVAGSFIPRGGHNPIEAAVLKKPLLVGEHTFNFAEITEQLVEQQAAARCQDAESLSEMLLNLARSPEMSHSMGQAAFNFARQNQGAVARTLAQIDKL